MANLIDTKVDLNKIEISDYLFNGNQNIPYIEEELSDGYTKTDKEKYIGHTIVNFPIFSKEKYRLITSDSAHATFSIIVPYTVVINISVKIILYIKSNLIEENKNYIIDKFDKFDLKNHTLEAYFKEAYTNGSIGIDDFNFVRSVSIQKKDAFDNYTTCIEVAGARDSLLSMHMAKKNESCTVNLAGDNIQCSEYSKSKGIYLKKIETIIGENVLYEAILNYPQEEEKGTIEDKIKEANLNSDCPELKFRREKVVASIEEWVDYRGIWKWKSVKMGDCEWVLYLPVLQRRRGKKELKVYMASYIEHPKHIEESIIQCLISNALDGAVWGLVLNSWDVARNAFIEGSKDCIRNLLEQTFDCLVVDLYIDTSPYEEWNDVV